MSSFRPDARVETPIFIPLGLAGDPSGPLSNLEPPSQESFATARVVGEPAADAIESPCEEGPSAEDLERLEAFERAAFERGVESARASGERLSSILDGLDEAAREIERAARTSVGANRELVLALSTEIAHRWVGVELSLDSSRFAAVLDRAIDSCASSASACLMLHPDDLALLSEAEPERIAAWESSEWLSLVGDPDLARGSFEIDAGNVRVDGRSEAILASLRDALSSALDEPAPSDEEVSS